MKGGASAPFSLPQHILHQRKCRTHVPKSNEKYMKSELLKKGKTIPKIVEIKKSVKLPKVIPHMEFTQEIATTMDVDIVFKYYYRLPEHKPGHCLEYQVWATHRIFAESDSEFKNSPELQSRVEEIIYKFWDIWMKAVELDSIPMRLEPLGPLEFKVLRKILFKKCRDSAFFRSGRFGLN